MYQTDEQRQALLREMVVEKIREHLANRDEDAAKAQTARAVWAALSDPNRTPIWRIVESSKPIQDGWVEPEELWRMTPEVRSDDRNS